MYDFSPPIPVHLSAWSLIFLFLNKFHVFYVFMSVDINVAIYYSHIDILYGHLAISKGNLLTYSYLGNIPTLVENRISSLEKRLGMSHIYLAVNDYNLYLMFRI